MRNFLIFGLIIFITAVAYSQNTLDAYRLSQQGYGLGARSLGLGMGYTGIADDYSAAYWNPAGLGQMRRSEISLGLSNLSYQSDATYLGNTTSFTNSVTTLNNLGLVYSLPTVQGSLVIAFGYGRTPCYTSALSFHGFNKTSSMTLSEDDLDFNTGYNLYLLDADNLTPFADSMEQNGKILEDGGLNNWMISGAVEAEKNLYLGASVNFVSGSYSYTRDYYEYDARNKYSVARYDTDAISQWDILNTINEDISGFTARLGLLYKFNSRSRIGINIKIPTYYTLHEDTYDEGNSYFEVPHSDGYTNYQYTTAGSYDFDFTTPFELSAGFSFGGREIMLAGSVEYTDWTQMKFSNGDPTWELKMNNRIKEYFTPTVNLHGGLEYYVPETTLRLRGGFAYLPSPYKNDPTSYNKKYVTGGLGVVLADMLMLDLGYAYGFWNTDHLVYEYYNNATDSYYREITDEKIITHNLVGTISYRF